MCGQIEIMFDEIEADGATPPLLDGIEGNVAIRFLCFTAIAENDWRD